MSDEEQRTAQTGGTTASSGRARGSAQSSDGVATVANSQPPLQPTTPTAAFTIQPPEAFSFAKPLEWEKWMRRFERFRLASNLHLSSDANQVNTLIYCMGDEADDILRGLELTEDQRRQHEPVKNAFDKYFVPKKNVIYERANLIGECSLQRKVWIRL